MSKIRADKFVNNAANGAPQLTYGAEVPVGYGITGAGGINITGSVTAPSFSGSGSGLSGIDATTLKDSGGSVKVQGNTSGVVVTGVSTFSGNVSVGGVITYEDVTSIDSVGIITAREWNKNWCRAECLCCKWDCYILWRWITIIWCRVWCR